MKSIESFDEIKNTNLFSAVLSEQDKIIKHVLICLWIFLSVFTGIEIRNSGEVLSFFIKGIILLLWTYYCLSSSIRFFERNIFLKIEYSPVTPENISNMKSVFNWIFKCFIKYIAKVFLFCFCVHCIVCLILNSTIDINIFLYPSIIVFSFGLLPGSLYLILEKHIHIKLSKPNWRKGSIIKVIMLLIISCMVSGYFLEVFLNTEVNYLGFEVVTTTEGKYFDRRNKNNDFICVEEFIPNVDDLGKYKDIDYQCVTTDIVGLFCSQASTLCVEYDNETYQEEKAKLEDKYVFLGPKLGRWYRQLIPESRFSIGSYDFKIVKKIYDVDCSIPSDFVMIGTSDEKKRIAYLYFVDQDLNYIDESMEVFVREYFKYDF